ncbi:uncharacterized protein [Temnothorax nylanderi]|uniref:uncharacterized protein n=1 Tax=Temnothorax nylanderi TaxID=102681 RepID=UPI003A883355
MCSPLYQVPLGDGIFCSKAAYNELVNVEESHADWGYALLKGVFGRKAHLMRMQINKKHTENEKFPSNFLMVAKSLHRDWLIKQKIQDESGQLHSKYSATEVEKYVNTLPGYLADRAYDMLGPRGARKRGGDLNAPECRRSGFPKPKRKYTRRGQPLVEIQQLQQQVSHIVQQRISQQLLPPHQQPLPQQQPPQQSPHQEPPYQQQPSQLLLQEQVSDYPADFIQPSPDKNSHVTSTSNPRNLRGLRGCRFIHKLSTWMQRSFLITTSKSIISEISM